MITDSINSSGRVSGGDHTALELTRTPHFQALEMTRVKKDAEEPGLGDPNFLAIGAAVIGLVVFTAVPVLFLVAIAGLNEINNAADNAAADADRAARRGLSSGDGSPMATSLSTKKRKSNGIEEDE